MICVSRNDEIHLMRDIQYTKMGYFDYTDLVYSCQGVINEMRLKELRKKHHISQLRLAMELGMNQNTISRYEKGIREADYATLILIADYFHCSIDYLLERTNNPEMPKSLPENMNF